MTYLTQYAIRGVATLRPARPGARVDERVTLNPSRATTAARTSTCSSRTRRAPHPPWQAARAAVQARITDCTNQIRLEFAVDTPDLRENSLYKIETLIDVARAIPGRPSRGGGAASGARERLPSTRGEANGLPEAIRTRRPPQSAPIPGSTQVPNSAGGYAWSVDDWMRLRRFLVLGSEGGSYYASERRSRRKSADAVARCLAADGPRRSRDRRGQRARPGAEERPGAVRARDGGGLGESRRRACGARGAAAACAERARTCSGSRQFVEGFRGWGRSLRRGVGALVRGTVGRRARLPGGEVPPARGRDAPRPAAAGPPGEARSARATRRSTVSAGARSPVRVDRPRRRHGRPAAHRRGLRPRAGGATPAATAALVREYGLPREALKSEHLTSPEVWEALLDDMPSTALIRNLATMTRIGLLEPVARRRRRSSSQLGNGERLRRARVHPIAVLSALRTYASGRGARGRGEWTRCGEVVDALDAAFYAAFDERRAGRHAAAARARRVGLDAGGQRRRRSGPEPA